MITEQEEREMLVLGMKYRQPIINRLDNQTRKGITKYGNTIEKSGHLRDGLQRLEYLAEELTDGLVYIEDTKAYMMELEDDIKTLLHLIRITPDYDQAEIDTINSIMVRYQP